MIRTPRAAALPLLAALLTGATVASAQGTPPPPAAPARGAAVPAKVMPPSSAQQIDTTFASWDTDHNGALSLDEFRRGTTGLRASAVEGRLHAQFTAVDTNKNGGIDAGEYGNLLLVKRAGASAPPLSTFDANRDQKLDFAEYTELVRRLAAAPGAGAAKPVAPAAK